MNCRALLLLVQTIWVLQIQAQTIWVDHQVNVSICVWKQPRAALLHDTVYIDGGSILWSPGFDNGTYGLPTDPGNPQGLVLTFNLSNSFTSTTNLTKLLLQNPESKARGGVGFADGSTPNYYDGALLANDNEFFLYGGAPLEIDGQTKDPGPHDILSFAKYQYGAQKANFQQGFHDVSLPDNVTQYITYGAGVNAPSENKAWYFSGLTTASHGPIDFSFNKTTRAANVSNTLISVDMSEQLFEKWNNKTLPKTTKGRASAEVVWVPVGSQGILVALGGVVFPEFDTVIHISDDPAASIAQSPQFMQTIDVYDVANDTWYQQPTKNGPGARTRGCAVVAPASDFSSFNIYYYGGYDGLHATQPFYDDVWVLSLPSFTWTLINNGTDLHARAGHRCFTPYPDQMMAFGGATPVSAQSASFSCLDQGPIVVFNMTSGEWLDSYDPTKYSNYGVNEKVQAVIGGNAAGGATATKPAPSGWATPALGQVFATPYDQKKIAKYWPYPPIQATQPQPDPNNNKSSGGGGLPNWVGPVLGVILGLLLVTGLTVLFCLWRRRKILRRQSSESGRTEDAGLRILAWIRGETPSHKAPTVATTEDTPSSPDMRETITTTFTPSNTASVSPPPLEMADTQIAELEADPVRSELHDTGLTPLEVHQRHSGGFQPSLATVPSPSETTASFSPYPYSAVSASTKDNYPGTPGTPRVDSPPLGAGFPAGFGRSLPPPVPQIPEIHEEDERPLRSVPETPSETPLETPSAVGSPDEGHRISIPEGARSVSAPQSEVVSPPTADDAQGDDYLTAKKVTIISPTSRKSVFKENEDDIGGKS